MLHKKLLSLIKFNELTGLWSWKYRPTAKKEWNTRYAHKIAGTTLKNGYVHIRIDGKLYYAHRLAWFYMTGDWPKEEIDHIDGNPSNNMWENLREATCSENLCNSKKKIDNTSGHKGIYFYEKRNTWYAIIHKNGKRVFYKAFKTKQDAILARNNVIFQYHKDFANA